MSLRVTLFRFNVMWVTMVASCGLLVVASDLLLKGDHGTWVGEVIEYCCMKHKQGTSPVTAPGCLSSLLPISLGYFVFTHCVRSVFVCVQY